jgi:hypothetical protein
MTAARALTLLTIAPEEVLNAWRGQALDALARLRPRGRLAALLAEPLDGMIVDGGQPASRALAPFGAPSQRRVWDALLEDLAIAGLHDAPATTLSEVFAALVKLSGREGLAAARLDGAAEPAYPEALLEPPGASGPVSVGGKLGFVVWIDDEVTARAALDAARKALSLPPGAFASADPAMWRDLAETLVDVLAAAAHPGRALLASRE